MKKLACLHAHHSNIEYIDRALQSFGIEILHFVDPILSRILKKDDDFEKEQARNNLKNIIKYIAKSDVDTLLLTCAGRNSDGTPDHCFIKGKEYEMCFDEKKASVLQLMK